MIYIFQKLNIYFIFHVKQRVNQCTLSLSWGIFLYIQGYQSLHANEIEEHVRFHQLHILLPLEGPVMEFIVFICSISQCLFSKQIL